MRRTGALRGSIGDPLPSTQPPPGYIQRHLGSTVDSIFTSTAVRLMIRLAKDTFRGISPLA